MLADEGTSGAPPPSVESSLPCGTLVPADEAKWRRRFEQLRSFQAEHGHLRLPRNGTLRRWLSRQRAGRREDTLAAARAGLLEKLGVEWGTAVDAAWEERFSQLVEYKHQNGNCTVPESHSKVLGNWVREQRRKEDRLSGERVARLDAVGFKWSATKGRRLPEAAPGARERTQEEGWGRSRNAVWEARFAKLVQYKRRNGNCNVPKRCAANLALGSWVAEQRRIKGDLPGERLARLNAVGFEWSPNKGRRPAHAPENAEAPQRAGGADAEGRGRGKEEKKTPPPTRQESPLANTPEIKQRAEACSPASSAVRVRGADNEGEAATPGAARARAGRRFAAGDDVWVRIGKATHPAVVLAVPHDGDGPRTAAVRWTTSNTTGSVDVDQLLPMHEEGAGDAAPFGHGRRARTQTRRYAPAGPSFVAGKKDAKGQGMGGEEEPPPSRPQERPPAPVSKKKQRTSERVTPAAATKGKTKKRRARRDAPKASRAKAVAQHSDAEAYSTLCVGSRVNVLADGAEWQATILGDHVKGGELGLMVRYAGLKAKRRHWVRVDQITSLVPSAGEAARPGRKGKIVAPKGAAADALHAERRGRRKEEEKSPLPTPQESLPVNTLEIEQCAGERSLASSAVRVRGADNEAETAPPSAPRARAGPRGPALRGGRRRLGPDRQDDAPGGGRRGAFRRRRLPEGDGAVDDL